MIYGSPSKKNRTIIIGGGAAGFFAAINLAFMQPDHEIIILEKTTKLLSKVRISGGGRCNVTHSCFENSELIKNYPRGNKELRQVFSQFSVSDTIAWFEGQGVKLKTEKDGRMFPVSDNSETIISCFLQLCKDLDIRIITSCEVFAIRRNESGFFIKTNKENFEADVIICASGGYPKSGAYDFLKNLGHTIDEPIPSLFTFNLPGEQLVKELQGVAVKNAHVSAQSGKMSYNGPVLITHWGLSGPAVLKLSAFAAQQFHDSGYQSEIIVNWAFPHTKNSAREVLLSLRDKNAKASPYSNPEFMLPRRLWEYFCTTAGIPHKTTWAETSKKNFEALLQLIMESRYNMKGKTTFKEEFVTCGGVNLKEVNFKTMESKVVPGLFLCGEVLNIDGITGGFNFQSAWSTSWLCARSVNSRASQKQL
jgi:predicted Rossmann fold flavoprotein